jgi:hypothetical protein
MNLSAILLTEKQRVPVAWRAVAARYHGKSV